MNLKDITKWNVRGSMVYAIGIWTMIGSYGYLRLFRSKDENEKPQDTEALEELEVEHNATQEERKPGFYVESTIRYRENFVPYSTRLMNLLKTLSGSSESTMESNGSEKSEAESYPLDYSSLISTSEPWSDIFQQRGTSSFHWRSLNDSNAFVYQNFGRENFQ